MAVNNKDKSSHVAKQPQLKREWVKFIEEMIAHGNKELAYEKAYPGKRSPEVNRSSGGHLMRRPEIFTPILQHQENLRKKVEEIVLETYKIDTSEVMSKAKKRQILNQIASGTMRLQKITFNKLTGEPVVVEKLPDHLDMMRAIELDSKINGDFAPRRHTFEEDLPSSSFDDMTTEEIKKLLTENQE